jgi:hypothetical protein
MSTSRRPSGLRWALGAVLLAGACAETRPLLTAVRASPSTANDRAFDAEQAALQRLRLASRGVSRAARAAAQAKRALQEARREAHEAADELERQRDKALAARREEHAPYERELFLGRCRILACLIGFTFTNGLARRSLSSAAPAMVAKGMCTQPWAESVFMTGFEAFAYGKFLVVPFTLLLGLRKSMLTQLVMSTATFASFLAFPRSLTVQLAGWVIFRIFSAMAVTTILPIVGAWFPRRWYGRIFALLFSGFQAGCVRAHRRCR